MLLLKNWTNNAHQINKYSAKVLVFFNFTSHKKTLNDTEHTKLVTYTYFKATMKIMHINNNTCFTNNYT